MSLPSDLFESALALPKAERADLAFLLLKSLDPPTDDRTTEEFRAELYGRIEAHRRGDLPSYSLDEARAMVKQSLLEERHK